jgi:hypothetical protein
MVERDECSVADVFSVCQLFESLGSPARPLQRCCSRPCLRLFLIVVIRCIDDLSGVYAGELPDLVPAWKSARKIFNILNPKSSTLAVCIFLSFHR